MRYLPVVLAILLCPSMVSAQVQGTWLGKLNAGGVELRLVFNISEAADGSLSSTMDSPDQGATGIPTTGTALEGDSLRIDVAGLMGHYEGVINRESGIIEGTWNQAGRVFPLNLARTDEVQPPKRPQEPRGPYPYDSRDVTIQNVAAGVSLAGTLTSPTGDGPWPAVVLVSGSGPQNRNEELLGHKPFLVLADYLTRRGVAVLRYDDRGVAESTGSFSTATSEDFAGDALAAADWVRANAPVTSVGIMGHSEGGLIAPMVAAKGGADFIVMLAGPGVSGEEILYAQGEAIARAAGASEEGIRAQRATQEENFSILKSEPDSARAALLMREAISRRTGGAMDTTAIDAEVRQVNNPWWRFFLTYDPAPTLSNVQVPVLAVIGEKDLQVPPTQNLEPLRQALADNPDATVEELPGLNHLFQSAETGAPSEYAQIEETFSPAALELIGNWILERFGN